ncbi:SOS response-associated peptidase family protein [Kineococcus gypseus]|uniref:SOS response-associated peptidase family protein n=1 Tax=Kineococcus gypseus TaxID=1637102 RepID=UPI003D7D0CD8
MCGRYALRRDVDELVALLEVEEVALDGGGGAGGAGGAPGGAAAAALALAAEPGAAAPVVLERFRPGEPDAPPSRSLRTLRWGLVPAGAPDASGGAACAPAAALLRDAALAPSALARRCLVPADAWSAPPGGADGRLAAEDGSVLALAGVYDLWRDPASPPGGPARWLASFAVVTAAPGRGAAPGPLPLAVPRDLRDAWLDPTLDEAEDVAALLQAVPLDRSGPALSTGPGGR